jgi:tetratricopeptide (TPR) repeat protein
MVNPTTWNRWVLLAAFALVVSGVTAANPAPAHAGPEDQARELLEDGDKYMRRGDARVEKGRAERARKYYERALEKYQKAYALVPKASLFFAIAEAEAKLARHLDAAVHYQKVIVEVDSDELKEQARQRLDGLKQHVGVLVIQVRPEGAEVRVDSEVRGQAPISGAVFLTPGEHTLAVSAEGYKPYEENVSLEAGGQVDREIILEREANMGKAVLEQPDEDPDEKPRELQKEPKWLAQPSAGKVVVGSAVTAGLLVGATATGLLALSKHTAYENAARAAPLPWSPIS